MKRKLLMALALCAALLLSACGASTAETPQKGTVPETLEEAESTEFEAENSEKLAQIADVWVADEGEGTLTIYENGGFLLDGPESMEGYLVYIGDDENVSRYALYLENNEPVPNAYLEFDADVLGTLAYVVGAGAQTFSRLDSGEGYPEIAGTWVSEEGFGVLTVYDNGGFLLDADDGLEGYLVYTEEDGEGLWESGPRYELYLENNERVPNCYFSLDDAHPGKLAYAVGGGAILIARPDSAYDDSGVVLRVLRADERFFATFADAENFVHDDGEFSTEIAFCPTRDLRNFKFLSIAWQDFNEDGAFFSAEELYSLGALTPERPLLVQTSFPGDMPTTGISYTDADGVTQYYSVSESGYDGSLVLSPFLLSE